MAEKPTWGDIERDRDKPISLPLDPEDALRGLLAVEPDSEPASERPEPKPKPNKG